MFYDPNETAQERVERVLAELYPRADGVSGKTIAEIHEAVVAKEAKRGSKQRALEAPKTGFEVPVVNGTSYANCPAPAPRRPKWMSLAEWRAHLAKNRIEPEKVRPKVRLCS